MMKIDVENGELTELDVKVIAKGMGKNAADEELVDYLSKDGGAPLDLEEAFLKYSNNR